MVYARQLRIRADRLPPARRTLGLDRRHQVFAPTANYLFDTAAFPGGWMRDVEADQKDAGGVVPIIIPSVPMTDAHRENRPMAVWADCASMTPWDLYNSFGDRRHLEEQWESMCLWLDKGLPRDERGFYATEIPQYGDWLDPRSLSLPSWSLSYRYIPGCERISNLRDRTYLQNREDTSASLRRLPATPARRRDCSSYSGRNTSRRTARLVSDTQTAYALVLCFGLLPEEHLETAKARLDWLTRWEAFKITTGFAGTPIILQVLADAGMLNLAYRMLQGADDPSWLYPVTMGATTIVSPDLVMIPTPASSQALDGDANTLQWERWNSMLPDGTINPGQMTSFNHYALGSVCAFLHATVGGLSAASPGWKSALIRPRPGGTLRSARTAFDSPYGLYSVSWEIANGKLHTEVQIPPNGEARVVLEGVDETVGSGVYTYETEWTQDPDWPPAHIQGPQGLVVPSHFIP